MAELKVTSAADYAQLSTEAGEMVPMPSGAVFRMMRANMDELVMMGAVPQSLVNIGMKAWKERGKLTEDMLEDIKEKAIEVAAENPEETVKDFIFLRETVRTHVLEPTIGYDESGALAVMDGPKAVARLRPEDFFHALEYITGQGGTYSDALDKFRSRRERRAAATGARRQKSRNKAEPVLAN